MTLSSLRTRLVNSRTTGGPAGVWRLTSAGIAQLEAFDVGPAILLVPAESVLLLAVDLPLASPRRRLESLPFAVEDLIAERVDAVHMAIGAEFAPRRYLVGIVDTSVMAAWIDLATEAGLAHCQFVPEPLALPLPPEGHWIADIEATRALVRTDDGTGFAVAVDGLAIAWAAGGRKPLLLAAGEAPAGVPTSPAPLVEPLAERLRVPALDLRQGLYARRRAQLPKVWRRVAIVAAAGVAAHAAIAAADTLMLSHIAAKREAETRALLAVSSPAAATSADLVGDATALLPVETAPPGRFLPLLARVSTALGPLASSFSMQALRFQGARVTLDIHAPDAATLGRVGDALRAGGLAVEPGAVATDSTGAHGSFAVGAAA